MIRAVRLPYEDRPGRPAPPLHANSRHTPPQHRRIVAEVKRDIGLLAREKGRALPRDCARLSVRLVWRPGTVRRRDGNENLSPFLKALVDGLVAAGVIRDDTPDRVVREHPILLRADHGRPGLWLVVRTWLR